MIRRQLLAIGLLAAATTLAYGREAREGGKTNPETGKSCVEFFASEPIDLGRVRMYFRNTCGSPFEIQIMAERTRKASIEAGTAQKPAKAYVTCRSDDQCETADWKYE
jgi:hypothetical protein